MISVPLFALRLAWEGRVEGWGGGSLFSAVVYPYKPRPSPPPGARLLAVVELLRWPYVRCIVVVDVGATRSSHKHG